MKRVHLDELEDVMLLNDCTDSVVIGYTTELKKDINGDEFEVLDDKDVYYKAVDILGSTMYMSQDKLFNVLVQGAEHDFYSDDIYAHGYPESRLVPSDHAEKSEESFLEMHLEMFREKLHDIIPYRMEF